MQYIGSVVSLEEPARSGPSPEDEIVAWLRHAAAANGFGAAEAAIADDDQLPAPGTNI